jgi:anion-transporting  ArsA/GET3 family ATPase
LVLTIDPAQRLAQALGIEKKGGVEVAVPMAPGLSAALMDPRVEFDQFVLGAIDRGIAKGLFNNRLYQQLVAHLHGSQEFTSLVRLLKCVESGNYDLVILDTPPAQNAVEFLRAPERIYALFQDSVMGWFSSPDKNEGWIKKTFHRGTRLVTSALESVTGSVFIHELKDFFEHVTFLKSRILSVSEKVSELLHSPSTGFLLVTGFDESKLKEGLVFQHDLTLEGFHLGGVIVNRWSPEWLGQPGFNPEEIARDAKLQAIAKVHEQFLANFNHRKEIFARFKSQLPSSLPVIELPDFHSTVEGIEDLQRMAKVIQEQQGKKSLRGSQKSGEI